VRHPATTCAVCGGAARYSFVVGAGTPELRCLWHAVFYQPVFRRAIGVASVVGTLLFLINQSDVVLTGHLTLLVACKIALTYLVPFSVSTYSALQINRLRDWKPPL
jgi:hypothetical protein